MRKIRAKILAIEAITPTALQLTLVRPGSEIFPPFLPGQYATLSFPGHVAIKSERSFSIASSASRRDTLQFGIRITGRYTDALRYLVAGDDVAVRLPFGSFTIDPEIDQSIVFLAGGIGVTPFLSIIRTAADTHLPNDLRMIYSVRSLEDAPFLQELQSLEKKNPHFKLITAVSEKTESADRSIVEGRITQNLIESVSGNSTWDKSFFICGPHPFMKTMEKYLSVFQVPQARIRTEKFSVASSAIVESGTSVPKYVFAAWGAAALALVALIANSEHERREATQALQAQQQPVENLNTNQQTPSSALTNSASVPTETNIVPPTITNKNTSIPSTPKPTAAPKTTTSTPTPKTVQPTPQPVQQQPVFVPRTQLS